MKRRQYQRIRPVACRHQTYRILSRRNRRVNVLPVTLSAEIPAEHKESVPYIPAQVRWKQRNHHYPKNRRVLTPSQRTRRRKYFLSFPVTAASVPEPSESEEHEFIPPVPSVTPEDETETLILPVPEKPIPASETKEERKIHHKKVLIWILAILLLIAVAFCLTYLRKNTANTVSTNTESSVSTTSVPETPSAPVPTPFPSPLTEQLEPQIEAALSPLQGEWSCYVKDLKTGETITYNSHKQHSASLIKLYTAGCYEQELKDGTIQVSDAGLEAEAEMISYSDNDAWVKLETIIGQGSYFQGHTLVHQFARSHGFPDTGRLVDKNDNYNRDGGNNWTSVTDTGNCLDQIYHGTYVSKEASARILDLMKKQVHLNKIPAGLPEGTVCANKTGELDLTQNDAAIVYGPKTDYILVVMSDGMDDGDAAIQHIIDLSSMVYRFMEE